MSIWRFVPGARATLACLGLSFALPVVAATETITWAGCGITKKAFMAELAEGLAATARLGISLDEGAIKVVLEGGGATRGIRDTYKEIVHMGGSCRMALPESDQSELHVELHPVAWDALVVIAHKDNPVDSISSDQLRAVLTGKVRNWKELGGPDQPLVSYSRTGKISGVGYALRQYLFKDSGQSFRTTKVMPSSGPLEQAIEQDVAGIGVTGISSARKRDVKILSLDQNSPTYENVRDGNYTMYRPLYIVTGTGVTPVVRQFIDYARSETGREILRKNGTVPYNDAAFLMSKLLIYGFGMQ